MKKIRSLLVSILILCSASVSASIWIKNGNFFMRFYDANEGNGLELVRFYNSIGSDKGMFGYGWGTILTPRLVSINGMIMIEELSGGGKSHFIDKKKDTIASVVDKLVKAIPSKGMDAAYSEKIKENLLSNTDFVFELANKNALDGYVHQEGTEMECIERVGEKIKKVKGGYIRLKVDGNADYFDNTGKMIRQKMKSGRYFVYSYNQRGNIDTIKDQLGRWMKFYFSNDGLLQKIVLFNNKVAEYKYDNKGDLIESKDTAGQTYTYKYNNYHKLVEVGLPSKTGKSSRIIVRYEGSTGRAVYQKTEDGWETFVEYSEDKEKNQNYSAVSLIKKFGKEVYSEKYEFWKRPRPDGSFYDYKVRETASNGKQKTTVYTMCCGTPLMIDDDGVITRFEYNPKGLLSKKVFPEGRIIEVGYDNKDRVSYVLNNGTAYRFDYNELDQLVVAKTAKVSFQMSYDGNGNLSKISDNRGNVFSLKYDQKGRLSELVSKYGSLALNYRYGSDEPEVTAKGNVSEKVWEIRRVYQDYLDTVMVYSLIDLT